MRPGPSDLPAGARCTTSVPESVASILRSGEASGQTVRRHRLLVLPRYNPEELQFASSSELRMITRESLDDQRAEILRVARIHGAQHVRVFGSRARETARPDSDLDLLIDLEPGRDLLDLVAMKQDLEDLLGLRVDVVSSACLSPYLREAVIREAVPL